MQTRSGFPTILLHANLLLAGNHRKLNRVTGPPLATAYRPADDSLAVAQDASRTRRSPAPTTPSRLWTARDTVHTDGSEIGPRGTIPRRIAVLTSAAVALRWIHEQRLWEQWFSQGRVEQYRTAVAPVWVRRQGRRAVVFLSSGRRHLAWASTQEPHVAATGAGRHCWRPATASLEGPAARWSASRR